VNRTEHSKEPVIITVTEYFSYSIHTNTHTHFCFLAFFSEVTQGSISSANNV